MKTNHLAILTLLALLWSVSIVHATDKPPKRLSPAELDSVLNAQAMWHPLGRYDVDTLPGKGRNKLKSFIATESGDDVDVEWTIEENVTVDYYELYAALDNGFYQSVAKIKPKAGKKDKTYKYLDKTTKKDKSPKKVYYKLHQIEKNEVDFLLGTAVMTSASATSGYQNGPDAIKNLLPQVTPKSPVVTSMEQYGQYPVSEYTGIPDIKIPIHTIMVGKLKIPIALSYHGDGFQVAKSVANSVGLGWSITGQYNITSQIRGQADQTSSTGMLHQPLPVYDLSCLSLQDKMDIDNHIIHGYDLERDIFTYRTPLRTNSFVVTPDSTYFLEADRSKLTFNGGFNDFTLLDDQGNRYFYDVKENTGANTMNNTTAWHINSINTSEAGQQVKYTYYPAENLSYEVDRTYVHTYHTNLCYNTPSGITSGLQPTTYVQNNANIQSRPLKEIFFPGGKIHFVLQNTDRLDLPGSKAVDRIDVYGYNFKTLSYYLIRSYQLHYVYKTRSNSGGAQVLFLDKVEQKDNQGNGIGTYPLSYNPLALPALHSTSVDKYGYYNGASNTTLMPSYSFSYQPNCNATDTTATFIGANRTPHSTYMKAWILESIGYPTGGNTVFAWEPNRYQSGTQTGIAGGLRIQTITSYSGHGSISWRYVYGPGGNGYGTLRDPTPDIMETNQFIKQDDQFGGTNYYEYNIKNMSAGVNPMINPFESSPVTYEHVTVYQDSTGAGLVGRTEYLFKDDIFDGYELGLGATNRQVLLSRHWARGQLLHKKVFGADNALKSEEINTYQSIIASNPTPNLGLIISRDIDILQVTETNGSGCVINDDTYTQRPYAWTPGLLKKTGELSRIYDDTSPGSYVERSTTTTFDTDYYQVKEQKHTNTDGDERIVRFRHVTDLSKLSASHTGAAGAYYHLKNNNQIYVPIETTSLRKEGSTTYYLDALLREFTTTTLSGRTHVLTADIYQARIDPLAPPTSFTAVDVTSGGSVTKASQHLHRLDFQAYSSYGNLTQWRRPGGSPTAHEWQTAFDQVYHHRMLLGRANSTGGGGHISRFGTNIPLLGVDTITAPHGIKAFFTYDAFGRFDATKDHVGDLTLSNEYFISATSASYISTHTPRASDGSQVMTNTQLHDGLGRGLQTILKNAAPSGSQHIVSGAVTYDEQGRTDRSYVPFAASGSATSLIALPSSVHGDSKPYSEVKNYDDSPLHRPTQSIGPGQAWHSAAKTIDQSYEVAPGGTIRKYVATANGATYLGTYGAGELTMHTTTSEQGNTSIEYKDNDGKVIQTSAPDSTGTYRHTGYIYDKYDRKRFVIQPQAYEQAATSFTIGDTYFDQWVYAYSYDELGNEISSHEPGGGTTYTVRDRLDRPVLTQSALQRTENKWSYVRYDAYGRVAHSGELTTTLTRDQLASQFATINQCYEVWSQGDWTQVSYPTSLNSAPTTMKENNIYDSNVPWTSLAPFDAAHAYHSKIDDVTGLLTGTFSYDSDDPSKSYFRVQYYNYRGWVIQTIISHHLSASQSSPSKIIISPEYNHVGEVLRTKTTFQIEGMPDIVHIDSTGRDHRGRPLTYASGINADPEVLVHYGYDVTGRQVTKTFQPGGNYTKGGTNDYIFRPPSPEHATTEDTARIAIILDGGTEVTLGQEYCAVIDSTTDPGTAIADLQKIQLSYNIRDWLTGINLNAQGQAIPSTAEGDLFAMKLDYTAAGRYDGTIGKQTWAHHDTALVTRSYDFDYDAGSRLKSAIFSGPSGEDYSLMGLGYDKNGNIKRLKRMGYTGSGFGVIDDLTYTYLGNHLMRVEDAVAGDHQTDFVNRNSGSDDYAYHADGCLKQDLNEDISDIEYDTYLNKPIQLTKSDGNWIKYRYDGSGTMIQRTLSNGTVWDYVGNMTLLNGVPYDIAMAEGRIVLEDTTWRHEYEYRDQVGNLRVAFTEREGKLQQSFSAGYEPFGTITHTQINSPVPSRHKFQGHEDLGDFGLRMTGMGARCYNQTIGRFMAHDPLSSAAPGWSGYRGMFNNPVNITDPTGMYEEVSDGYGTVSQTSSSANYGGRWRSVTGSGKEITREIQKDESGKATGVRIGYEAASQSAAFWAANLEFGGPGYGYGLYLAAAAEAKRTGRDIQEVLAEYNRDYAEGAKMAAIEGAITILTGGLGYLAKLRYLRWINRARAVKGVSAKGAVWAQKTFSGTFSAGGKFAGQTVDEVASALRRGAMSASDVPINVIVRNGQTYILNTRSSAALMRAGIPRSSWNVVNRTGVSSFESMLSGQLSRNGLINGTNTIRQSGTQLILTH